MNFTTGLTHRVNPRDYLIVLLVHEEIQEMRISENIVLYNFTEQARPYLCRGSWLTNLRRLIGAL